MKEILKHRSSFAKGGSVNDISQELYSMNLDEIDGEGIYDIRKLKAIIYVQNDRLRKDYKPKYVIPKREATYKAVVKFIKQYK